nr:hypothetical protein [Chlamydiota bacterium]
MTLKLEKEKKKAKLDISKRVDANNKRLINCNTVDVNQLM